MYTVSFFAWFHRFGVEQEEGPDSSAALELARLEDEQVRLKTVLRDDTLLFHSRFHQDWGQLFKSGYQDSRFAKQARVSQSIKYRGFNMG